MTVPAAISKHPAQPITVAIDQEEASSRQESRHKSSIETAAQRALSCSSVTNESLPEMANVSITASSSPPRSATPLSPKVSSMKGVSEHPSRAFHILKWVSPRSGSPLASSPRALEDEKRDASLTCKEVHTAGLSRRAIDNLTLEPMKKTIRAQIESHYSGDLTADKKASRAGLYLLLAKASHNEAQDLQALTLKALLDTQEAFSDYCIEENKSSRTQNASIQQIYKNSVDLHTLIQDYPEHLAHHANQVDNLLNQCKEKAKIAGIDLGEQKVYFKLGVS